MSNHRLHSFRQMLATFGKVQEELDDIPVSEDNLKKLETQKKLRRVYQTSVIDVVQKCLHRLRALHTNRDPQASKHIERLMQLLEHRTRTSRIDFDPIHRMEHSAEALKHVYEDYWFFTLEFADFLEDLVSIYEPANGARLHAYLSKCAEDTGYTHVCHETGDRVDPPTGATKPIWVREREVPSLADVPALHPSRNERGAGDGGGKGQHLGADGQGSRFTPKDTDIDILRTLVKRKTRTPGYALNVSGVGETTKNKRLRIMEKHGFVDRAEGEKSGWAISPLGRQILSAYRSNRHHI